MRPRTPATACLLIAALWLGTAIAEERRNWFDDPFERATAGLPGCPEPEPPLLTEAQMRAEAHYRAERGTSCYQAGRCRLPNAYLYDKEIVPRVVKAIRADARFAASSLWVEGQRRWVWLKGCVSDDAHRAALVQLVQGIDDVEAVIDQLQVGTTASPTPYRRPRR
ncbi:MAG: BON domain-containing protein [Burkholderiaceae bacterium]